MTDSVPITSNNFPTETMHFLLVSLKISTVCIQPRVSVVYNFSIRRRLVEKKEAAGDQLNKHTIAAFSSCIQTKSRFYVLTPGLLSDCAAIGLKIVVHAVRLHSLSSPTKKPRLARVVNEREFLDLPVEVSGRGQHGRASTCTNRSLYTLGGKTASMTLQPVHWTRWN